MRPVAAVGNGPELVLAAEVAFVVLEEGGAHGGVVASVEDERGDVDGRDAVPAEDDGGHSTRHA